MWKYVKGVFFSIDGLQKGYGPVCQNGEQKGKGFDLNIVEYPPPDSEHGIFLAITAGKGRRQRVCSILRVKNQD